MEIIKPLKHRAILTPNIVEFSRLVEGTDFDGKNQAHLENEFFESHANTFGKLDSSESILKPISDLAKSLSMIINANLIQ